MLSTCPSCLNQILHEDGKETISCECGESFSPFLTVPPEMGFNSGGPLIAMSEKNTMVGKPLSEDTAAPLDDSFSDSNPSQDFSESEAAFAELRNFGESLGESSSTPDPVSSSPDINSGQLATMAPTSQPVTHEPVPSSVAAFCPITAGDELSGYEVDAFLQPISVWCPASLEIEDPLQNAHNILSQRAEQLGANGVVSVRWSFTPDGSRILLTGTPVKCRKAN